MLLALKLATLRMADGMGLNSVLLKSRWRRHRLLILCYHGVSLEDEHEWGPALYLPPALFRDRMEALARMDCAVLPFGEALGRLYAGSLPPRAVTITFDDGGYDFYKVAHPILQGYGFPATLYLTTYYSEYNRPVFDVAVPYLLWKGRLRTLTWPEFLPAPIRLDERGRSEAVFHIRDRAREAGLSAAQKDDVLAELAARLEVDYAALCAKRILHLMTPAEAGEVASAGVDIQLHTHRHRLPLRRDLFLKEIEDNRRSIAAVSAAPPVHFCYPWGSCRPEFREFLRSAGVESAVTTKAGLAEMRTDRYALPRLSDVATLTAVEFSAWVGGLASFLPRRVTAESPQPPGEEAGGP
jgi:peptidoglycan/xylan/chitin deacetylase (PgdA/CDA1 family)